MKLEKITKVLDKILEDTYVSEKRLMYYKDPFLSDYQDVCDYLLGNEFGNKFKLDNNNYCKWIFYKDRYIKVNLSLKNYATIDCHAVKGQSPEMKKVIENGFDTFDVDDSIDSNILFVYSA